MDENDDDEFAEQDYGDDYYDEEDASMNEQLYA